MMESKEKKRNITNSSRRDAQRLWSYLTGLEQITRMMEQEITSQSIEVDNLLKKLLPFLLEVFNSEFSFVADDKGSIILSKPGKPDLYGKTIPDTVKTTPQITNREPLVSTETAASFKDFKAWGINSILLMKSQIQENWRWIGICNGKNEPEPFIGADKKFLQEIIHLFLLGIKYEFQRELTRRKTKTETEFKIFSERFREARYSGDWRAIWQAAEDFVYVHPKLNHYSPFPDDLQILNKKKYTEFSGDKASAIFLDAWLCEFILKFSSVHNPAVQQEKQYLREIFKAVPGNKTFDIILPQRRILLTNIPTKKYKRSALAGARILLTDLHFLGGQKEGKSILSDTSPGQKETSPTRNQTNKTGEPLWDSINRIIDLTDPKDIHIEQEEFFQWLVDWLRTQWLRIYYLARHSSVEPVPENIDNIKIIYSHILKRTAAVIHNYLSSGSIDKENEEEETKPVEKKEEKYGVTVDSDWLLAFLAQDVLLSRSLNQYYGLAFGSTGAEIDRINPLTRVRYLLNLSHFVLYVLHCARFVRQGSIFGGKSEDTEPGDTFLRPPFADVPQEPAISISDTFLFILSEYAYREIGVPRELLIYEKLRRQLNFELPLYAAGEFYRDHCYHVVDVCLLGEFLLKCGVSAPGPTNGRTFLQEMKESKKIDLLKNWYVAALCHDLGYVVEQVEKLMGPVEKLKGQGLDQFTESLKKGLEAGKGELNKIIGDLSDGGDLAISEKLKEQISRRIQELDHGIIGWLYLCQVLKGIEIPFSSMAPALLAVLRHNLTDHDGQIHQEPLSFLLILCDHLQEWGRPRVAAEQLACGVMENLRFPGREPHFDKKIRMNRISIKGLTFDSPKRGDLAAEICDKCIETTLYSRDKTCLCLRPRIEESGLEFKLSYHEAREADFEPVLSWLFFCRDFQCTDYSHRNFLFPISVHFRHSLPKLRQLLDWRVLEMDIFEEFAHTHEEAAYLCQWIESARKGLEGIRYKVNRKKIKIDGEEKEIEIGEGFTLHLDRFGRPLVRGLEGKHWKDFVKWKWRWLAQKYIVRNVGRWYPGIG